MRNLLKLKKKNIGQLEHGHFAITLQKAENARNERHTELTSICGDRKLSSVCENWPWLRCLFNEFSDHGIQRVYGVDIEDNLPNAMPMFNCSCRCHKIALPDESIDFVLAMMLLST